MVAVQLRAVGLEQDQPGALRRSPRERNQALNDRIEIGHRVESPQSEFADIDAYLLAAMQACALAHGLLQTIPGIDRIVAALILIEIGDDMGRNGRAGRAFGLVGRAVPGQQRERGQT